MPATPRRTVALSAALALVVAIPTSTLAVMDEVKETSKSVFTLLPDERKVAARATVNLVNQKKPLVSRGPCKGAPRRTCTTTLRYHITGWGPIQTPLDAVDVTVTGRKAEGVPIGSDPAGTTWVATFPPLYYKKKQVLEIAYDLADSVMAAGQQTRVTTGYAHFCWWPEATDKGTARAILPAGWEVRSTGAATKTRTSAGSTVVSLANQKLPGNAVICTDALDPDAMVRTHILAPRGQLITLSAWPDDQAWATSMATVIEEGLPLIERLYGSAMPFSSLTIQEAARVNDFGSPTDLDRREGRLLMDEDFEIGAAPLAALARTWLTETSIADPWLAEGLALWAGLVAAGYGCVPASEYPADGAPDLHDWQVRHEPNAVAPMLPVWQAMAACTIVEEAAEDIGMVRMRAVIDSLLAGTPRYGDGSGAATGPADWTDWLDAVDELGYVPAGVNDLGTAERALTTYGVATMEEMAGRLSARSLYHDTLAAMEGTALPAFVDALMEAWAFDEAVPAISEAKRAYDAISTSAGLDEPTREALLRSSNGQARPRVSRRWWKRRHQASSRPLPSGHVCGVRDHRVPGPRRVPAS